MFIWEYDDESSSTQTQQSTNESYNELSHTSYVSKKESWLYKKSRHLEIWRKRWVVLTATHLYTYKNKEIYQNPTEAIPVDNIESVCGDSTENTLSITMQDDISFILRAESTTEMNVWVNAIKENTHCMEIPLDVSFEARLDLLICGYLKQYIILSELSFSVIELIKNLHTSDTEITLNILCAEDKPLLECYLDRFVWNVLNINKFTLSYDIVSILHGANQQDGYCTDLVKKYVDEKDIITYNDDKIIGFAKIDTLKLKGTRNLKFKVYARDIYNHVIIESDEVCRSYYWNAPQVMYTEPVPLFAWNAIDKYKQEQILLNDWLLNIKELKVNGEEMIWKRLFYYVNFCGERYEELYFESNDLNCLHGDGYHQFHLSEYKNAKDELFEKMQYYWYSHLRHQQKKTSIPTEQNCNHEEQEEKSSGCNVM
eukprot:29630_1